MKNWVKYIKEHPGWIIQNIALWRIQELNEDRMIWDDKNFKCDNGKEYYFKSDAIYAETEWLKQEAEADGKI